MEASILERVYMQGMSIIKSGTGLLKAQDIKDG
jgi:hypothetical protein